MSRKSLPSPGNAENTGKLPSIFQIPRCAARFLNRRAQENPQEINTNWRSRRRMSETFGGVRCIEACSQRKIEREHAFVERDPELKSLRVVLWAMGMQLIVRLLRKKVALSYISG